MPDDATTILDIVLICLRVERFVDGVDEAAFHPTRKSTGPS